MSYTREQRAANAAKAANQEAARAPAPEPVASAPESEGSPEPQSRERPERPPSRNDPRRESLEWIEREHDKRVGLSAPAEEPAPAPTPEPAPAPVETPVPSETSAPAPVAEPAAPEAIKTVKQVVDGITYEVPQSEIDDAGSERAWRVERAAKNRLDEAKQANAEAKRLQAQIEARIAASVPPPPPDPTDDELIQAIRFGTAQEAKAAIDKVAAKGRGQVVDPNAIRSDVLIEMRKTAAAERFKDEFADIAGNQILLEAAIAQDRKAMAKFHADGLITPQFDFSTHYRNIGNQVRSAFGRSSQPATAPAAASTTGQPSPASDRVSRKDTIVNLPTAAARAELPAEEKPLSAAEITNQMRKARGQLPH